MTVLLLLLGCPQSPGPGKDPPVDTAPIEDSAGDTATDTDTGPVDTADTDTADTADSGEPPACVPGGDADGDGWTEEAGDCDDCDAIAYPGAPELCDGWDQDCDGEPIGEAGCAEGIDFAAYPSLPGWVGGTDYAFVDATGVSASSSGEDVLWTRTYAWQLDDGAWVSGAAALFRDMPDAAATPWPEGAALLVWPESGYSFEIPSLPFVDHDGDGAADVVLNDIGSGWGEGAVFLLDGPGEAPVEGAAAELARAIWYAPDDAPRFAYDVDAAHDLDGDGLGEILVLSWGTWGDGTYEQPSSLYVVSGRPGIEGVLQASDQVVVRGTDIDGYSNDWETSPNSVFGLPDLDGDGADEVLIDASDIAIASGVDLVAGGGASFAEIFVGVTTPTTQTRLAEGLTSPGDWDGDGIADLAWTQVGDTDENDCLFIASYLPPFGGDVLAATHQQICMDNVQSLGGVKGVHDVDGDGRLDPVFRWWGDLGEDVTTQFLVPTSWLDGGRVEATEVGIRIGDQSDGETETVHLADLDDDGLPEFVSTRLDADFLPYDSEGLIRVLQGFPIPFDDPTRW